jgi:hypothetical protein
MSPNSPFHPVHPWAATGDGQCDDSTGRKISNGRTVDSIRTIKAMTALPL